MTSLNIDIEKIRYNPTLIQSSILDAIEASEDANVTLNDPTNPFIMALESNIALTNDALNENIVNMRKIHASLATNTEDLFHHISDIELVNMFASPATATILFTINLNNLIEYGYAEDNKVTATIPIYSVIVVNNTKFTLLNSVKITYFKDTKKSYIEQMISDDDLAIKYLGVLNSNIVDSGDGNKWILFETLVKQVERLILEDTIIAGMGFRKEIEFKDQFHYANVYMKNTDTNNEWLKIDTTHSDIVFDPTVPTIFTKVINNRVIFKIPEIYLINRTIYGNIKIIIYTCKGNTVINLNKLPMEEYVMTLGDTTIDNYTAVSTNIVMLTNSNHLLDGGRDQRTIEEMRDIVINNTTGLNDLPLTENEIDEVGSYDGFTISKVLDIISSRYMLATKISPEPVSPDILSNMSVWLNSLSFILADHVNNRFVNIVDTDTAVIRSGCVFKNNNNIISMLTNVEYDTLRGLIDTELINTLRETKYYKLPFYYITEVIGELTTSRVYDLDKPSMKNLNIENKANIELSVNLDKFTIYTDANGYKMVFSCIGNKDYDNILKEKIHGQLMLKTINNEDLYFHTTMDPVTGYLTFDIGTDFYITEDNGLSINNAETPLNGVFINLDTVATIIIYTTDTNLVRVSYSVNDELEYVNTVDAMALSKETIEVNLGHELKYLWNPISTDYTNRKYQLYTVDMPMIYQEDIYDFDSTDGSFFTPVDANNDGIVEELSYNILHSAGDPVYDENGNTIFLHRKGDVVLDEAGRPIIDGVGGIIRHMNMLMVDYEYYLISDPTLVEYKNDVLDYMRQYIKTDMERLNLRLLDNTVLFYAPSKSNDNVKIKVGYNFYVIPNNITPVVTLYADAGSQIFKDDINSIKSVVGFIIDRHLNKGIIKLEDIKVDITNSFGADIKAVKVVNLDDGHDFEMFNVVNNTCNLTINKKLLYNINRDINVEYDMTVNLYEL